MIKQLQSNTMWLIFSLNVGNHRLFLSMDLSWEIPRPLAPPVVPRSILQVAPCAPWHLVVTCRSLDGCFLSGLDGVFYTSEKSGDTEICRIPGNSLVTCLGYLN